MNIEKEREAFEAHIKSTYPMGEQLAKDCGKTLCELYSSEWQTWQAAKAQAVPEAITIGNELQSWVAVNSFPADDGEGVLPVIDANSIAAKIEKLTGASQ